MSTADRVRDLVAPLIAGADLELYDLELAGGVLRILVDRPEGADIDTISEVARRISRALDEHDPIAGGYALEVSSPGLERPLRTPQHFAGAVGVTVKVKTRPGTEGDRRIEGAITDAGDTAVTIVDTAGTEHIVAYRDIERARTTFEWGPASTSERKTRTRS